ncbi:MAG: hypothetical protein LUC35_08890 [Clostridiales bacterium]|nr:hypothetical protein [Clostridiales bacterium]MCD7886551.1 hypothetical protein [Clostridiales bacterium]MCD8335432.1 hypothetical protein [Clostridiales bacterium]
MANKEKVNELLNTLYEMIDEARGGFGGTCRIDRDKALDILDEVRRVFPVEIDESQRIMAQRAEYLAKAEKDADRIRKQAEEQARQMIDESEIQARVKAKATEILQETEKRRDEMIHQAETAASEATARAEQRSTELQQAANSYCDDVLRRTEEALNDALAEVQKSRSQFQTLSGKDKGRKKTAYDAEKES